MKVSEVLNYNRIIKSIIDNSDDINALVKFKLLGMLKQFEPTVQNYEQIREEKINEYGSATPDGRFGIIEPKENDYETVTDYKEAHEKYETVIEKFYASLDEILNSDSDIEIKKFKSSEIMNGGLSANELVALYDLIEE